MERRERRPWVRAFRADCALPWGERGPVDLEALARLAASFRGEMDVDGLEDGAAIVEVDMVPSLFEGTVLG